MSHRTARLGRIAATAAKSAAALAAGACLAFGFGAGVAHAVPATTPDPLKTWSVAHIEATSIANAEAAASITLSGSFKQSGETVALNIGIEKGLGCNATTVGSKSGTMKMIVIGKTIYLYLDKKFWVNAGGSNGATGAEIYAQIDGRYLKVSSASLASSLTPVCNLQGDLTGGSSKVTVTRGKVSTLDGVRVLELKNSDGEDVYVTDSSVPEIFEVITTGGSNGVGTFRVNVGARVTVAAPAASDVINGAKYGF
jgi:hypothetical protein